MKTTADRKAKIRSVSIPDAIWERLGTLASEDEECTGNRSRFLAKLILNAWYSDKRKQEEK
jgi:hypothetical protein